MRILRPGNPAAVVKPQLTCDQCGCFFEYDHKDVHAEDRPCSHPYVTCPQAGCGHEVNVMARKEPVRRLFVLEHLTHGTTWTPTEAVSPNPLEATRKLNEACARDGDKWWRLAEYSSVRVL